MAIGTFDPYSFPWLISLHKAENKKRLTVENGAEFGSKALELLGDQSLLTMISINTTNGLYCGSALYYLQRWIENKYKVS